MVVPCGDSSMAAPALAAALAEQVRPVHGQELREGRLTHQPNASPSAATRHRRPGERDCAGRPPTGHPSGRTRGRTPRRSPPALRRSRRAGRRHRRRAPPCGSLAGALAGVDDASAPRRGGPVMLAGLAALSWTSSDAANVRPCAAMHRSTTPSPIHHGSTLAPLRRSLTCDTAGQGGDQLADAAHAIQQSATRAPACRAAGPGRHPDQRAASRARRR